MKQKNLYKLTINIFEKKKIFLIKKELFPYASNILATIAILSNYIDAHKFTRNLFLNFKPTKGRGDL